jgi:hypothetical protein
MNIHKDASLLSFSEKTNLGGLQKQGSCPSLFDDDEDRDLDEAGGAELEEAEQQIADRAGAAQKPLARKVGSMWGGVPLIQKM